MNEAEEVLRKLREARDANRHLQECAPELLIALQKLLGNAIQLNDAGDGWTEITADTQDVEFARAAIARATA